MQVYPTTHAQMYTDMHTHDTRDKRPLDKRQGIRYYIKPPPKSENTTRTHAHPPTRRNPQTTKKHRERFDKLVRSCRAALDVFRFVAEATVRA